MKVDRSGSGEKKEDFDLDENEGIEHNVKLVDKTSKKDKSPKVLDGEKHPSPKVTSVVSNVAKAKSLNK